VAAGGFAGSGVAAASAFPKILNITVPQVGHLPLIALRPFFMVSWAASTISFFALHLTQYPSDIEILPLTGFMPAAATGDSLIGGFGKGQQVNARGRVIHIKLLYPSNLIALPGKTPDLQQGSNRDG
jgi:hypothetical protein